MNNKLIIILALIGILVVSGCSKEKVNEIQEEPTSNAIQIYWSVCYYKGFYVEYVEEILTDNCYAVQHKPLDFGERVGIDQTFKHPYNEVFGKNGYYKEFDVYCERVDDYGTIYCLKDNSTCLMLKENICNIINVTKVIEELR